MRRSGATPCRSVGVPLALVTTSCAHTWWATARLSATCAAARGAAGSTSGCVDGGHLSQHQAQGLLTSARVIPIQVQRRLQARAVEQAGAGLLRHVRQLPPLLASNHAQSLAQGVPQKIVGIFDPASAPQRRAVQGRPQLARAKGAGGGSQFDGAFEQTPIQLLLHQAGAKGDEGTFATRGRLPIETVQDQLPASIHGSGLNDFVIGDAV